MFINCFNDLRFSQKFMPVVVASILKKRNMTKWARIIEQCNVADYLSLVSTLIKFIAK